MSHRKIVIVGDAGVGKTNLVRFLKEVHFEKKYFATVGVEVHPYSFDEGPANYVIQDLAGNSALAGSRDAYLADAHMAIVMQDVNRKSTLKNAHEYWIPKLTTTNMIVVGNKSETPGENLICLQTGMGLPELIETIQSKL